MKKQTIILAGIFLVLIIVLLCMNIKKPEIRSETQEAVIDNESGEMAEETDEGENPEVKESETSGSEEVSMPHSAKFYVEEEWSVNDIRNELESLGFTDIETEGREIETTDDAIYDKEVRDVFDDSKKGHDYWKEGDMVSPDHKIVIWYNTYLTPENCEDFAKAISSEDNIWEDFAKEYDKKFIVFEAAVEEATDYDGLTTWSATVRIDNSPSSLIILSPTLTTENIDRNVKEGDRIIAKGWINYYQTKGHTLHIDTIELKKK